MLLYGFFVEVVEVVVDVIVVDVIITAVSVVAVEIIFVVDVFVVVVDVVVFSSHSATEGSAGPDMETQALSALSSR